uniref:Uncharacterized protein n=1 Tax=Arundo donax TaxID=35708 RepID=A0A0A8YIR3_ARUDO
MEMLKAKPITSSNLSYYMVAIKCQKKKLSRGNKICR